MITEDYVSFEVAKLLKEKGFDAECRAAYTNYGQLFTTQIQQYITNVVSSKGTLWDCIAPTHQMAMKWLREVHNIMISPYALSLGYYFEIVDLTTKDITGCKPLYKVGIPSKEDVLSTYEEAVEVALKYTLENLV